jgi:hypothetical protein
LIRVKLKFQDDSGRRRIHCISKWNAIGINDQKFGNAGDRERSETIGLGATAMDTDAALSLIGAATGRTNMSAPMMRFLFSFSVAAGSRDGGAENGVHQTASCDL